MIETGAEQPARRSPHQATARRRRLSQETAWPYRREDWEFAAAVGRAWSWSGQAN